MNEFLSAPFLLDAQTFALRLALVGGCSCGLLLIAARILRRRSEPLQYGVLFGGVIGLLAIPALVGIGQLLSTPQDEVLKVPMEMLPDLLNQPAAEPSLAGPLALSALSILWGLGFVFGLARLICALWKQNRSFIRQSWQASFWTAESKARLAHQLGLARFPAVDVSPAVPMPMVIGIWQPAIVLPAASPASRGQAQWEAVLLHEAAHIARGDHWAALAQRIAVLLFWWCPFVYPLSRRLNELREDICDDYALQGPCDQIAYAELLIESAERLVNLKTVPISLALLDSAHGGLEARITRLLAKEKRTMTKLSLTGRLFTAGVVVAACMLTMAATAFAQGTPGKKVQIKIIIDGKEIDITDGKLLEYFQAAQKKDTPKAAPKDGPGIQFTLPFVVEPAKKQADPRIEALVKQAEAIKPGSGAEIRNALKGAPKPGEVRGIQITGDGKMIWNLTPDAKAKAVPPATPGKKVIILQIDGAKLELSNEEKLKKAIEKGIQLELQLNQPIPGAAPKGGAKKDEPRFRFEFAPGAPAPKNAPAATDIDALRRQLDRITADLNALRKQLDAGSKK